MSPGVVFSCSSPQALLHASSFLCISPFDPHSVPFSLICLPDYCVSPQLLVLELPAPFQRLLRFGGYQPVLKGTPGWESVCQWPPKGVSERDHCTPYSTPIFPVPSYSQESPTLLSPHPSPASTAHGSCVILTSLPLATENLSVPKPSPLLSIPMQSLTSNSSSVSLLTFWMQVFTATTMEGRRGGVAVPHQVVFSSFSIVYSLSHSYFCSLLQFNNPTPLFPAGDQPNGAKL